MKKTLIIATLAVLSLSADYHDQSVTFNVDNRNSKFFYQFDFVLRHQSTFELDDYNAFILHALSNPRLDNTYHHELGVGYRRMFEDFGFGTNILYANQYAFGIFNHNFVPGLEIFYKDFKFAYNRYLPVKTSVQKDDLTYLFHDVSEIFLSYRVWETVQVGFTPYYNHQTQRFGYRGMVSAFVFDNIEFAITPYCEPRVQNGVAFSLTYHFGAEKDVSNSPLSKSHRFFFTKNKKDVEKFTPKAASVIMPTSAPVVIKPLPVEEKKNWWQKLLPNSPQPSVK
jgi:hypothetical protein